jgi:hypothetical protein
LNADGPNGDTILQTKPYSCLNYACAMGIPDDLVLQMLELGADATSKNKMGAGKYKNNPFFMD